MGIPPRDPLDPMELAELAETTGLLGLNQAALADLAGVDARTVRSWVAGKRKVPLAVASLLRLMGGSIGREELLQQVRRRAPNKAKLRKPPLG